jgi:hypothetical protein
VRSGRAGAVALIGAAVGGYVGALRPWMLTWGATPDEAGGSFPGDDVVASPRYQATHAVTVHAPVAQVWAWLVQIGQGRGGMYSYDWVENLVGLDMHSADEIDPALQKLDVGDEVWLTPRNIEVPVCFHVVRVEPPHILVLGPAGGPTPPGMPYPSWAFRLTPNGESTTRLVCRFRSTFEPGFPGTITNKYLLEPIHFVMERKMLLTIKQRAEQSAARQ